MVLFRRSQCSELRKNQFATLLVEFKEIQHWVNWEGRYMSSRELKKVYGIKRSTLLLVSQWENENPIPFEEAKELFAKELGLSDQERKEAEVLYEKWKAEWEEWNNNEEPAWVVDADQAGWLEEQQYLEYERRINSPAMDEARTAFVSALKNMKRGS
ncbi:hypothetical protein [Thermoactinomyces sp. CICC 10522]|uniref:hypothetical protein n=1 Tax=Thermoactinomyces sp. CICC 10522 TaxID=2767427 RepID=UPI0018DD115C|nr:hypothetical protein [Thermoactinomyces sp. CICC 10522]MBH8605621.1 hypothetical protein [Thermoactinomyces sp. CICC 10522]